jgi:O-antigen ligase
MLVVMFVLGCAIAGAYTLVHPAPAGPFDDVSRSGGTLGDPNELAAVLVVGLLASAALAVIRSIPGPIRVGAIFAGVMCLAGIALSVSRGGLLALGVALILGVFVAGRWRVHMAALTMIVAIGTVGYFTTYAPPAALQRITENNGGSGRANIWVVGWRMFEANPVHGVGAGNFPITSVHYLLSPGTITASRFIVDQPQVTHNTYLNELAEGGIVGAALFIALLGFALRCFQLSWRGFRRSGDRDLEILAYALFTGLVGFLAASFFLSEEFSKQLWVLLALGPALLRFAGTRGGEAAGTAAVAGGTREPTSQASLVGG